MDYQEAFISDDANDINEYTAQVKNIPNIGDDIWIKIIFSQESSTTSRYVMSENERRYELHCNFKTPVCSLKFFILIM